MTTKVKVAVFVVEVAAVGVSEEVEAGEEATFVLGKIDCRWFTLSHFFHIN